MCRRNCVYASGQYNQEYGYGCDYAGAARRANREEQTRLGTLCKRYKLPSSDPMIRELMEPEHCPFYEWDGSGKRTEPRPLGEKAPPRKAPPARRLPPVDEDMITAAYDRGLSDLEIAKELNIKPYQVANWRQDRELESNFTIKRRERSIDNEQAMALYYEGKVDWEIAEVLGVNPTAIFAWRTKNRLPAHGRMKIRERQDLIRDMYEKGCSDREIAMAVGLSKNAITWWRKTNSMPANYGMGERSKK